MSGDSVQERIDTINQIRSRGTNLWQGYQYIRDQLLLDGWPPQHNLIIWLGMAARINSRTGFLPGGNPETGDTHLFPGAMAFDAGRTPHIGSCEDLAASRYERAKKRENRSAAPRAWSSPGLTAVVVFNDDAPTRRRPLFDVEAVYRNLVVDGVME